jgi:hypothetical protein
MNNNTTLTLPEGLCTFSRGALVFTRPPSQEEWEQIGRYVHAARGSSLRWMADWRMEGRRQFGDEVVAQAERQLEFEFKDLRAAEALEKLDGVHPSAPSDAHAFVAARLCENSYDAQEWLEKARTENLSPVELQKSIKAGEIVREDSSKGGTASAGTTGILTLEAIHMDFLRWVKRAEDDGFPVKWEPRRLAKVKSLLADMAGAHRAASTTLIQLGGEEQ